VFVTVSSYVNASLSRFDNAGACGAYQGTSVIRRIFELASWPSDCLELQSGDFTSSRHTEKQVIDLTDPAVWLVRLLSTRGRKKHGGPVVTYRRHTPRQRAGPCFTARSHSLLDVRLSQRRRRR
jgi:hypothetical protein